MIYKESEANSYVILALEHMGIKVDKIIVKKNNNNLKFFLFYKKKYNGSYVDKLVCINNKNYLKLLLYGIKISNEGSKDYGFSYVRKNS